MERVDYEQIVIQDLLNLQKRGELDLTPWYQRRSVWKTPQKSYLINTIFERKPIPTIYLRHTIDLENERSLKEIVDGQQRIRSMIEFREGDFSARHPAHSKRVKYSDLKPTERERFLMTSLSIGYLVAATEADVIDIFGRINSVSKNLNAQEKRNANFSGEYKQFALKKSSELIDFWRTRKIFTSTDISRMEEVEFISDLTMNLLDGLTDYSSAKLEAYYKKFDEEFPVWGKAEKYIDSIFARLNDLSVEALADTLFSREPLLFSLCMVMKNYPAKSGKQLESIIRRIDDRFNLDIEIGDRPRKESDFITAAASSTQRIASRKIRDTYIASFFR